MYFKQDWNKACDLADNGFIPARLYLELLNYYRIETIKGRRYKVINEPVAPMEQLVDGY